MVKLSVRMGKKDDLSHLKLMLLKSGFPEEQERLQFTQASKLDSRRLEKHRLV